MKDKKDNTINYEPLTYDKLKKVLEEIFFTTPQEKTSTLIISRQGFEYYEKLNYRERLYYNNKDIIEQNPKLKDLIESDDLVNIQLAEQLIEGLKNK